MPLDTTVGGANANSYADWAWYKAYWATRLFSVIPLAADQPTAETALQWAARLMDFALVWTGAAVDDVQVLTWPRTGMLSLNKFIIPSTVIPNALKDAQSEYAGILLSGDRTKDTPALKVMSSDGQIMSVRAGPVSVNFGSGRFSNLASFDAFVRSLGPQFAYLSKAMPDSVRLIVPSSWYVQAQIKRPLSLQAF